VHHGVIRSTHARWPPSRARSLQWHIDGAEGFPSLYTPHTALLSFHGVNVHGSKSPWLLHIKNLYEDTKTELIAKEMVGKRTFIDGPFFREGLSLTASGVVRYFESK